MLYNTICAFFWLRILVLAVDTLISAPDKDIPVAYTTLEPWTRCAQTLAVAEILHAATGKPRVNMYFMHASSIGRSFSHRVSIRNHSLACFHYLHAGLCPLRTGLGHQLCLPRGDRPIRGVSGYATGMVNRRCYPLSLFCYYACRLPRPKSIEVVKVGPNLFRPPVFYVIWPSLTGVFQIDTPCSRSCTPSESVANGG